MSTLNDQLAEALKQLEAQPIVDRCIYLFENDDLYFSSDDYSREVVTKDFTLRQFLNVCPVDDVGVATLQFVRHECTDTPVTLKTIKDVGDNDIEDVEVAFQMLINYFLSRHRRGELLEKYIYFIS